MFEKPPEKIIYCYGVYQDGFKELEENVTNISMHQGLPSEDFLDQEFDTTKYNLLILDDLINDVGKSKETADLFTRGMHHKHISIAILFQNLFHQSTYMRTISLNLSYFILLKTFRDRQQIKRLATQMFDDCPKRMVEAYEDCIKIPRGYLVVANVTTMENEDRLLTNIFPHETLTAFQPK
jgi:hypothetical protein